MKYFALLLASFAFVGCTKSGSSISPAQAVGCDIESAVVAAEASAVSTLLSCTNVTQVQQDMMTALGNANLCAAPGVAAVSSAQMKSAVSAKGVIGSLACPIVVNVLIGYASSAIPSTWGCSTGSSAQSLSAALTAACVAAVPI